MEIRQGQPDTVLSLFQKQGNRFPVLNESLQADAELLRKVNPYGLHLGWTQTLPSPTLCLIKEGKFNHHINYAAAIYQNQTVRLIGECKNGGYLSKIITPDEDFSSTLSELVSENEPSWLLTQPKVGDVEISVSYFVTAEEVFLLKAAVYGGWDASYDLVCHCNLKTKMILDFLRRHGAFGFVEFALSFEKIKARAYLIECYTYVTPNIFCWLGLEDRSKTA